MEQVFWNGRGFIGVFVVFIFFLFLFFISIFFFVSLFSFGFLSFPRVLAAASVKITARLLDY